MPRALHDGPWHQQVLAFFPNWVLASMEFLMHPPGAFSFAYQFIVLVSLFPLLFFLLYLYLSTVLVSP
jgi:hypothetical protein